MFERPVSPADVAFVANLMRRGLPLVQAPDSIWASIERELVAPSFDSRSRAHGKLLQWPSAAHGRWVLAAAAVLLLAAIPLLRQQSTRVEPWDVVRLDARNQPLQAGELVETNAASRAMIRIGEIGTVELEPNTRLALRFAGPNEHRLALARGTINAQILAPPRVFFVETPASTVVDLGCAYTMQVDEAGVGMLRVTSGWASLEWDKRESLVPAGASCPTRPQIGPGTPAFDDATERLRQALLAFDFEKSGPDTIETVLAEARDRDTLTLWHLLSRVEGPLRARVFDRMAALTPLPAGVSRERALALDPATLKLWREELAWTW